MAINNIEMEKRFEVLDSKNIITSFDKVAERILTDETQIDHYYVPAHRDFTKRNPIKEWLRVRITNYSPSSITYKNWKYDKNGGTTHQCDEYESNIDNHESFTKLLSALDFKEVVIVEKVRNVWKYNGFNISLDDVKGLPMHIEFEAIDSNIINDFDKNMQDILNELDIKVKPGLKLGYPHKLMGK